MVAFELSHLSATLAHFTIHNDNQWVHQPYMVPPPSLNPVDQLLAHSSLYHRVRSYLREFHINFDLNDDERSIESDILDLIPESPSSSVEMEMTSSMMKSLYPMMIPVLKAPIYHP